MTTKYLENLHRDGPLSWYSIAKILFAPGSLHDSKMPFEQLFLDDPIYNFTRYGMAPITSTHLGILFRSLPLLLFLSETISQKPFCSDFFFFLLSFHIQFSSLFFCSSSSSSSSPPPPVAEVVVAAAGHEEPSCMKVHR